MAWQFRYAPAAIQGLYLIPRGIAAEVTAAIKALADNPQPPGCEAVPGRENTYRIMPAGHTVEYEVVAQDQRFKILFIR